MKSLIKITLEGDERLWFINQDNEYEFNQQLSAEFRDKFSELMETNNS